jgi:hypothetical protein
MHSSVLDALESARLTLECLEYDSDREPVVHVFAIPAHKHHKQDEHGHCICGAAELIFHGGLVIVHRALM